MLTSLEPTADEGSFSKDYFDFRTDFGGVGECAKVFLTFCNATTPVNLQNSLFLFFAQGVVKTLGSLTLTLCVRGLVKHFKNGLKMLVA
ncbi:hypothetical protein [Nostoc sp. CALU 1950]|uniref:hypothetical protein n=1 Tax=Nostoc sp. CALU 1950 TaxID=3104321 RepID=UPI003EBDA058